MIFPVKRVKEELINEFAVSKMNIDDFSKMHSIQHMMYDFSNARIFLRPGTTDMRTSKEELFM